MKRLIATILLFAFVFWVNEKLFSQGSGKWRLDFRDGYCSPTDTIRSYQFVISPLCNLWAPGVNYYNCTSSGTGSDGYTYWTDRNGNFWMRAGKFKAYNGIPTHIVYKYSSEIRTFIKPAHVWWGYNGYVHSQYNTVPAHLIPIGYWYYKGIALPGITPSGRKSSMAWTDHNGYLWLYGGSNTLGSYNDLWKYDVSTNRYTWVNGDSTFNQAPVFGTQGVAAASNQPGGRDGCITNWVDNNNNLWLFGGKINGIGNGNDLWKYNISTGLWTWMKGSNILNDPGSYGTLGVAAATNNPPARTGYAGATDANGNLLLFGGDNRNDVWRYDVSTNNWTWLAGSNLQGDTGHYAGYCQPGFPAARTGWHAVPLNPHSANLFYLFSGSSDSLGSTADNDLWLYNANTNTFKWLSGKFNDTVDSLTTVGAWGTMGVWNPRNRIPARTNYAMWCDGQNNLYILGGRMVFGKTNHDFWIYTPDTSCVPVPPCFTTYGFQQGSICGVNDSFMLPNYKFVYNTGTYIDTIQNLKGCDSIVTTTVTLHSPTYSQVNVSICQPNYYLTYTGNLLTTSGTYNDTTKNYVGCDSIITLHLSVNPINHITVHSTICSNQSYTLPTGNSVSMAGTYIDTISNHYGCDSIVTTYLVVKPISQTAINATICSNQSYQFKGNNLTNSGTYYDTLQNYSGCDSIISLQLTVLNTSQFSFSKSICNNESYLFNNQSLTVTGSYYDTLQNHLGCDSVISLQLTVLNTNQTSINQTICSNQNYVLPNGLSTNITGVYIDTIKNHYGCDSVITNNLTVLNISQSNVQATICSNQNYLLPDGQQVNQPNTYTSIINNHLGCDSLITTQLSVIMQPMISLGADTNLCVGDLIVLNATSNSPSAQYVWNDLSTNPIKIITNSGLYSVVITAPPCAAVSDSIKIIFEDCDCKMLMPNAFSPNADNKNDELKPIFACDLMPENYSLTIYNRWGELIFQTTDFNIGWDGTYKNKPQPISTYVYLLQYTLNNKQQILKGDVELVR